MPTASGRRRTGRTPSACRGRRGHVHAVLARGVVPVQDRNTPAARRCTLARHVVGFRLQARADVEDPAVAGESAHRCRRHQRADHRGAARLQDTALEQRKRARGTVDVQQRDRPILAQRFRCPPERGIRPARRIDGHDLDDVTIDATALADLAQIERRRIDRRTRRQPGGSGERQHLCHRHHIGAARPGHEQRRRGHQHGQARTDRRHHAPERRRRRTTIHLTIIPIGSITATAAAHVRQSCISVSEASSAHSAEAGCFFVSMTTAIRAE